MRVLAIVSAISVAITAPASGKPADPATAFIQQTLEVSRYKRADADLNGDGRTEIFVYATDRCGSGGCDLFVLSPHGRSYRLVMNSSVTQLPIRLLPTSTRGWRDVGVTVWGGGITRAYMARLRFDGHGYPDNPTAPPAIPLKQPSGKVLISR